MEGFFGKGLQLCTIDFQKNQLPPIEETMLITSSKVHIQKSFLPKEKYKVKFIFIYA